MFDLEDLNPEGTVYYPDLVQGLVERYGFAKYPTTPEQLDESKGINFEIGKWKDVVIEKVQIVNAGLSVETAHTDKSEAVLEDAIGWAAEKFHLAYTPELLSHRAFVSQITFHSDVDILALHPVLSAVSGRVSKEMAKNLDVDLTYAPLGLAIGYDKLTTRLDFAAFTLERREGVPWRDYKFFSTAPVRTGVHLELLAEVDKAMGGN